MNNTLIATLGGLSALIGWGTSDWLASKSSKRFQGFEVNAAIQIPGVIITGMVLLFAHQHLPSLGHASILVLVGLCFTTAYLFFIKALSTGAVGVVVPLANTYPLFTLVLSLTLLSTAFTNLQVFAMIVIISGAILLAYEKRKKNVSLYTLHKGNPFCDGSSGFLGSGLFHY